jgi:uncharacterized protein
VAAEPQFIALPDGSRRFAVLHPANGPARGAMLYVHPLAEEMNKSRRMAAEQARRLAAAGWTVLVWDLQGCGDSEGEFADARWQAWCEELVFAAGWLRERCAAPLWLWGLRVGALLAVEVARRLPEPPRLLLWQPSSNGKLVAQQFLRLVVAAELIGGQAKGAMQAVRDALARGEVVNVGGYGVRSGLIDDLEAASMRAVAGVPALIWLELGDTGAEPTPATQRQLDGWRAARVPVQAQNWQGPAFWQTVETEDAPALWHATQCALEAAP